MKKVLGFIASLLVGFAFVASQQAGAAPVVSIHLTNAYYKANGTYTVVVEEQAGTKLSLYVNDTNPVSTTTNRENWATFRNVRLSSGAKLSFTKVITHQGKTTTKAINYSRYVSVTDHHVTFSSLSPAQLQKQAQATAVQAAQAKAAQEQAAAAAAAAAAQAQTQQTVQPAAPSCTNGSYVNSAGATVCSPEVTSSAPAGATAQCGDGTYSFSQSRRGTCSYHGGVASWL